ncbi:ThiJ/PfpI family protein [Colletotrichum graminicola]|nr:ThiJ/PfpI family protein [Colletotrichum graminicola]
MSDLTIGGITNGNDLVAAYARNSKKHFPPAIAEIGCSLKEKRGDSRKPIATVGPGSSCTFCSPLGGW